MIGIILALAIGAPPQVVVWGADYCPACKPMESVIEELAGQGYRISYHSVEDEEHAAAAWKIVQLPTTAVIQDGVELERIVGRLDRAGLLAMMKRNGIKPPPRRKTLTWDTGRYL